MTRQYIPTAGPNALDPNLMSTKERLRELCGILAAGLVRLRTHHSQVTAGDGEFRLHFPPDESGCPSANSWEIA